MRKYLQITQKTFDEYEVTTYQELWEKVKGAHDGLSLEVPTEFEKVVETKANGDIEDKYIMVMSDDKEDRHGDFVMQNFDLKFFKKNSVLLDSHNYSSITHIIGTVKDIKIQDNKLKGELVFSKANPKGVLAKEMVDEGTLKASSIGFIPLEFDKDGRILKSELLELSMVSVPANPRATLEKDMSEDEELEEVPTPEIEEEVIETKVNLDKKKVLLNSILTSVKNLEAKDLNKKKRELFKALRSLSK